MQKPQRPADFPLFPHQNGQWCKKFKGKAKYFGVWADPDSALKRYELFLLQQESIKKRIEAVAAPVDGKTMIEVNYDQLTIPQCVNLHLNHAQELVDIGELGRRTWEDRKSVGKLLRDHFGDRQVDDLTPADWQAYRTFLKTDRTAVSLANLINRTKTIFNWLAENDYCRLPRWGTAMKRPAKRLIRIEQEKFDRSLSAEEIQKLLCESDVIMRAMILLGVNCGFGNSDCGRLEIKKIDFANGWLTYPRHKTGVKRRAKLWPETIAALNAWLQVRPNFSRPELFVTKVGETWTDEGKTSPITQKFRRLLDKLGMYREGVGFYSLRRMTETIGGRCKDQIAVNYVMGHFDSTMGGIYRLGVDNDRLEAVSNEIRGWLWSETADSKTQEVA